MLHDQPIRQGDYCFGARADFAMIPHDTKSMLSSLGVHIVETPRQFACNFAIGIISALIPAKYHWFRTCRGKDFPETPGLQHRRLSV